MNLRIARILSLSSLLGTGAFVAPAAADKGVPF